MPPASTLTYAAFYRSGGTLPMGWFLWLMAITGMGWRFGYRITRIDLQRAWEKEWKEYKQQD